MPTLGNYSSTPTIYLDDDAYLVDVDITLAVYFDDNELLDVLENRHGRLRKKVAITGILVDQTSDGANIRCSSRADAGKVHFRSGFTSGNKMVSRIP